MKKNTKYSAAILIILVSSISCVSHAQDKIYTTDGRMIDGKVSKVNVHDIQFKRSDVPDGPVYTMNKRDLDSIVYSTGAIDYMDGYVRRKGLDHNIPQLNTWTFDLLGFTFLSVSQSYERRLKDGIIGLRIPLYVGFVGGGFAGMGSFMPGQGVYYPQNNNGSGGFSIATGLNPKFYLFKRRVVRAFAGPEATIGYSSTKYYNDYYGQQYPSYPYQQLNRYGTFAMMGKVGLSLNPTDKFNITFDGGAGAGNQFGGPGAVGWTGLWHIGFSMGTNF